MALNFTSDIMSLYASKIAVDANYTVGGNFGLTGGLSGDLSVTSTNVTTAGTYTTIPTVTAPAGDTTATFTANVALLVGSTIATAGTGYTPADVVTLVGGTFSTSAQVTVATTKVVSATVGAGGSGGTPGTQTVTGTTGTGTKFTASVTVSGGGAITAVLSITGGGSYTVNPTSPDPVTGAALTGATLNVVLGVNTFTVSRAGVYSVIPSSPIATTGTGAGLTLTGSWGVVSLNTINAGAYAPGTSSPLTLVFGSGAAAATAALSASTAAGDEQKMLMLIEVIRSYLAETTNMNQVRDIASMLTKGAQVLKGGTSVGEFNGQSVFSNSIKGVTPFQGQALVNNTITTFASGMKQAIAVRWQQRTMKYFSKNLTRSSSI